MKSKSQKLDTKSTEERSIIDLSTLGFKCIKVLGKYNYREMKKSLKMHRHEGMIEICYLEKGSQYYHIEGKDYHLKGGDILLTYPGEIHGTKNYPEEKGRLFWLIISLPAQKKRLLNLSINETKYITERLLTLKEKRIFKGSSQHTKILNKIFTINKTGDPTYRKIQIGSLLLNFLLSLLEYGEESNDKIPSEEIRLICQYINNNIKEDFSLEMLAKKMKLSLSHFKYRFKKEMGVPPADYILGRKIEMAKELLPQNLSVYDVAYELSFSSPSYFATVFKRYTGNSPSVFLQKETN